MEKAYVILAHKNPQQLYRLVRKLDDQSSSFFIHIDKKVPVHHFSMIKALGDNVHFVHQVDTRWAGWSLVQATINALQAIRDLNKRFDRITLLSGQDYPVKSNQFINDCFKNARHRVFMEFYTLPNYLKWKNGGGMYRVNKYFLGMERYKRYVSQTLNLLATMFPVMRRKMPAGITTYAGSQWWTIDMYALDYILEFIANNPDFVSFYKFSFAPDELFFQTILLNSKDEVLRESILNDNKRYMNWKDPSKSHPEILEKKDFGDISRSDALFARKFDSTKDTEILDMIDRQDKLAPQYANYCNT